MSYVARVLTSFESVRANRRPHWVLWVRPIAALLFLGVFLIGIYIFVRDVIHLASTEIALTQRRLIYKTGFVGRHASELVLSSVEAVKVEQSVWGRLLGCGRVEVHGTGEEIWRTPLIADPVGFEREIAAACAELGGAVSVGLISRKPSARSA